MASFADVGWTWEGQGTDPGVPPSVFGVGEAANFFGLSRSIMIFHPTTRVSLGKLADKAEVAVDFSKWKQAEVRLSDDFYDVAWKSYRDSRPAVARSDRSISSVSSQPAQ